MIRRGKLGRLDWKILLLALGLCSVGLLNVYSGTRAAGMAGVPLFAKQLIWICLGILAFFAFYLMSDGFIEEIVWPVFWGVLVILVVVLVIGKVRGGAQRWISIGAFNFQPSEFAKVAVVLALAKLFTDRYHYGGIGFKETLPAIVLTILPFLLVALQPDLGTAGVFMIILLGMIVVACVKGRVLLIMGAAGILAVPGLWFAMKDYQRQRVLTFLDPERDPLGAGYHVIQSKIAVGSGGILGKGYLQGTQGALRFLPEQHTDFAFAVFAEEWGFLGTAILLALFIALVYRGFFLASRSQHRFASFACGGLTIYFLAHIVINLAMVCGLFPVVGIPLPFVSYGGSSMVTNMMALGIMANLARSRFTFQAAGESSIRA
ncbi:MAG: rod shape-determining protein RodA [Deltaproteobacteria bacterium]|nr:rod shape-determining protein RodA [Deltaproteobacteria bacterium]PWB62725.1 MAG: rod shape-determining protein RodA [Deltaproteobacteria bacterium]